MCRCLHTHALLVRAVIEMSKQCSSILSLHADRGNGERRSLKRQETTSTSISEANKVEEVLKPYAGRQKLCKL